VDQSRNVFERNLAILAPCGVRNLQLKRRHHHIYTTTATSNFESYFFMSLEPRFTGRLLLEKLIAACW